MNIPRVSLNEAIDLIDSCDAEAVLVLLAGEPDAAALRSALSSRPTMRTIRWVTVGCNELPADFAHRLTALLGLPGRKGPTGDAAALLDRALDALMESPVELSLIVEGVERATDRRLQSILVYLLEFLPPTLRVVLVGSTPGIGTARLLVRDRARMFALDRAPA